MERQTFDLSGGAVNRLQQVFWGLLGVFQFITGLFAVARDNLVLGAPMIALGVVIVSTSLLMRRLDQFTITLDDECLTIKKGMLGSCRIPWT